MACFWFVEIGARFRLQQRSLLPQGLRGPRPRSPAAALRSAQTRRGPNKGQGAASPPKWLPENPKKKTPTHAFD